MICTATNCDTQPGDGITLCHEHTSDLERNLAEVDSVWEDLQVTVARLDVGGRSVGSAGTTTSKPPVNLDASDKAQTLEAVLSGWHSVMIEGPKLEATVTASLLLANVPWIRKQDWAGDLYDELDAALEACRRATDRAADRITLGACGNTFEDVECPGTMITTVGGRYGRCRTCGATCDAQERQRWIIGEAWHVAAPLPVILRWLESSGHARIKVKRARAWVYAGKLAPVAEGMFTPAAVLAAHRTTPSGRMAA